MADFLTNLKENLLGTKSKGEKQKSRGRSGEQAIGEYVPDKEFYSTAELEVRKNWYKQLPYSFVFTAAGDKTTTEEFYLPISPSNINITTHFATNVISTMYGTVEEHSEQRYFDIAISGTTGMAPRYYDNTSEMSKDQGSNATLLRAGRAGFEIKKQFGNNALGGFFSRTLNVIENTINQAADFFDTPESAAKTSAGVDLNKTGYVAFHNLYKFLLTYKLDASAQNRKVTKRKQHPLAFRNYKDNNEYDISINNFQLSRDASNPMLYNYNITMRAYNLRTVGGKDTDFDVSFRKEELGLNGINTSTTFSKMTNKARKGKNSAFSAIASIKGFGL